jgi:uncharacterized phiE125 gp8 family phage protein
MPAVATPIVSLTQAKAQLNITDEVNDSKLTDFIAAASQMIVNRIGPVAGSLTVSEWHDGGSTDLLLYAEGPVQSITSVTESFGSVVYTLSQITLDSGSVTTPFGYTVDLDQGLLVRRAAGVAIPFAFGEQNIHVTFVAGYATTPPDITQATLLLLQHMWETQRGVGRSLGSGPMETSAYSMPNRVMEILSPYIVPGIA